MNLLRKRQVLRLICNLLSPLVVNYLFYSVFISKKHCYHCFVDELHCRLSTLRKLALPTSLSLRCTEAFILSTCATSRQRTRKEESKNYSVWRSPRTLSHPLIILAYNTCMLWATCPSHVTAHMPPLRWDRESSVKLRNPKPIQNIIHIFVYFCS